MTTWSACKHTFRALAPHKPKRLIDEHRSWPYCVYDGCQLPHRSSQHMSKLIYIYTHTSIYIPGYMDTMQMREWLMHLLNEKGRPNKMTYCINCFKLFWLCKGFIIILHLNCPPSDIMFAIRSAELSLETMTIDHQHFNDRRLLKRFLLLSFPNKIASFHHHLVKAYSIWLSARVRSLDQ